MHIAIVQFPGSNCERETILAVKRAGLEPVEFLWNEPKEKLMACLGYIIVGGFSYEDRSRSGIIAALDPILQIIKEQSKLNKPVLGICNGAQILVEAGLVPGLENDNVGLALTDNKRMQCGKVLGTGFYNAWVNVRLAEDYQLNAFTRLIKPHTRLKLPVAHGEGRFVLSRGLLSEIKAHGLHIFQYCDAAGNITPEFPVNPNGSIDNIAAIANKAGNVMAIMPHPERTLDGDILFQSMKEHIAQNNSLTVTPPLYYLPRPLCFPLYQSTAEEWLIELIITDNQALSVENALNRLGIAVKIKRYIHWEITGASLAILEKIKKSGVLFNGKKEKLIQKNEVFFKKIFSAGQLFLIRPKEDILGYQKQQHLENHFAISNCIIQHGILWQVISTDALLTEQVIQAVHNTLILYNPYSHNCYRYSYERLFRAN